MSYAFLFFALFSTLLSAMELEKENLVFPEPAIEIIATYIAKNTPAALVDLQIRNLTLINKTWHRVINSPQVFKKIIDLTAESKSNVAYTTVRFAHRWGNMPVFKHPEFQEWLAQEKERLAWEDRFLSAAGSGGQIPLFLEQCKEDKKKFNINAVNIKGETALYLACTRGNLENVTALINAGANINTANKYGITPLKQSVHACNSNLVKLLISHKADPNIADDELWTPLIKAAFDGSYYIVEELIEAKADLNRQTNNGMTALTWAAEQDHLKIVKKLVKAGARLDLKNDQGKTALDIARKKCKLKSYCCYFCYAIKELLENAESKMQA